MDNGRDSFTRENGRDSFSRENGRDSFSGENGRESYSGENLYDDNSSNSEDDVDVGGTPGKEITFPVWLWNRLISTGLKPVLGHTENHV